MGVSAAESDGVIFHQRQEVQSAGGGGPALRPDVAGERQAAGLSVAPQNTGPPCESHPHRGAAGGAAARMASRCRRESVDHDRRGEGRIVKFVKI